MSFSKLCPVFVWGGTFVALEGGAHGQCITRRMAMLSDGAIVGSAIIKLLEQYARQPPYIGAYVKSMKDALDTPEPR